jgi:ABC-type transport system involved in multi-copper enzyme maturation permease subunit
MNIVFALAGLVIKELYRRKDFYVLFVLTAIITLVMGSLNFFNDDKLVLYVKDIALLLIWISALAIAVGATARQLPSERENRTIFPLLAKPVSRAQVIFGKFLGCWLATGLALLVFYIFFGAVSGSRDHHWPLAQYAQAFLMHWAMLAIVVAMVLLGSLLFSAPSANATISVVIVVGILLLGRHLATAAIQQPEPLRTIIYFIYYLIPHLEWYDLRDFVIYEPSMVSWLNCLLAMAYAGVYTSLLLLGSWLVFRHRTLSV